MKRFKMGRKESRRQFKRSASHTHRKNVMGSPVIMRGGIRL